MKSTSPYPISKQTGAVLIISLIIMGILTSLTILMTRGQINFGKSVQAIINHDQAHYLGLSAEVLFESKWADIPIVTTPIDKNSLYALNFPYEPYIVADIGQVSLFKISISDTQVHAYSVTHLNEQQGRAIFRWLIEQNSPTENSITIHSRKKL